MGRGLAAASLALARRLARRGTLHRPPLRTTSPRLRTQLIQVVSPDDDMSIEVRLLDAGPTRGVPTEEAIIFPAAGCAEPISFADGSTTEIEDLVRYPARLRPERRSFTR